MRGLEVPADLSGRRIHRNHRRAVFVVQRGALAAEKVRCGVAGGQVNQIELGVKGHGRPDVGRAARVGRPRRRRAGNSRIPWIPGPYQRAAVYIESAHHARRFTGGKVICHPAAHHHPIAGHQRGGGLLIVAGLDFAHVDRQIHATAVAEIGAGLAGVSVKRYQPRVDSRQE